MLDISRAGDSGVSWLDTVAYCNGHTAGHTLWPMAISYPTAMDHSHWLCPRLTIWPMLVISIYCWNWICWGVMSQLTCHTLQSLTLYDNGMKLHGLLYANDAKQHQLHHSDVVTERHIMRYLWGTSSSGPSFIPKAQQRPIVTTVSPRVVYISETHYDESFCVRNT